MKTINKLLLIAISLILFSCGDIIEEDITNDSIFLTSPQNNEEITSNVVTFQWNSLKGADDYRIQIFSSSQSIVLDSLVSNTSFSYQLNQGEYQWRVRGENFAYASTYSMNQSFSVIETSDLTNQQVILSSPTNNFYTNASTITFNWQALNAAESYHFQLINSTTGQTLVYENQSINTNSITLDAALLTNDAEYQWKVKALNTIPTSTPFASRTFYIDRINPNQPQNTSPLNNSTQIINQPITFNWTIPSDTGTIQSTISYVIEFSNTSDFSSIFQTSNASSNSFQQTFQSEGDYFWRIIAKDISGNTSTYSSYYKFTIE